jgi:ribosome-binding protein aMBF1 (putative translation factor)
VAEKIERFLGIRLISSMEAEKSEFNKSASEPLTLGDVVTVKKRKK